MAPHPRLGYFPSELPVNTCFDGICTNMSRKGPFECQTDSPRRPHLRPRKGTNLDAGNPSPALCPASSRESIQPAYFRRIEHVSAKNLALARR